MQLFSPDPYNIFKKILDFAIMTLYLAMSFLCAMITQFVSLKVTEKLKSKKKRKKRPWVCSWAFSYLHSTKMWFILNPHWHEL